MAGHAWAEWLMFALPLTLRSNPDFLNPEILFRPE